MKKKLLLTIMALVCALTCAFGLTACGEAKVNAVDLNRIRYNLLVDSSLQLEPTVWTSNSKPYKGKVTWTAEPADMLSVDENGLVTALKSGTGTVTATAGDKSASCTITIDDFKTEDWSTTVNRWATYTYESTVNGAIKYRVKCNDTSVNGVQGIMYESVSNSYIKYYTKEGSKFYRYMPTGNTGKYTRNSSDRDEYIEMLKKYAPNNLGLADKFASFTLSEKKKDHGEVVAHVFTAQNLDLNGTTYNTVTVSVGFGAGSFESDKGRIELVKDNGDKITYTFAAADRRFDLPQYE